MKGACQLPYHVTSSSYSKCMRQHVDDVVVNTSFSIENQMYFTDRNALSRYVHACCTPAAVCNLFCRLGRAEILDQTNEHETNEDGTVM